MEMYDFDNPPVRSGTDSAKWQKYNGRDILPMWVADMDFSSPPAVIDVLHQRVAHGVFGYGAPGQKLVETIMDYLQRSFQWKIEPQWIIWLPGLVTGLNTVCRCVGDSGSAVMTTVPVYPPFLSAPRYSDRRLVTSKLHKSSHGWEMDFDDIEKSIGDRTRLFILCNPHNPTGRVFTRNELLTLARICLSRNLIICSDEIHCDLILQPGCRHIPLASLSPEIADNTITLMAPSKTFNIPGLSCSYAVIPDETLRRRFKLSMAGIVPHVNVMGIVAAQAAYQGGQQWLDELKIYLRENRDLTENAINRMPGLSLTAGQATYLAWIDASELNVVRPAKWFETAGVGLSDGAEFGAENFLRLNFGCSRALLTQALERMAAAVTDHSARENKGG